MKQKLYISDSIAENEIVVSDDCEVIVQNSTIKIYNDTDNPIHVCYKNSLVIAAVPENAKYLMDITQYSEKMIAHIFILPKSKDYYRPQTILNRIVVK